MNSRAEASVQSYTPSQLLSGYPSGLETKAHRIFVIVVQVPALLDRFPPFLWYRVINVSLVYYFRY